MSKTNFLIGATALLALACASPPPAAVHVQSNGAPPRAPSAAPNELPVRSTTLEEVGLDSSIMDRSANACDDFYQLACGGWLKRTSLPDEQSVWTRSFSEMRKTIETNLQTMLESFANAPAGTVLDPTQKMLGDFYASCLDEPTVETLGTKPIDDLLTRIEHVKKRTELGAVLLDLQISGGDALVRVGADVDKLDTSKMVGDIWRTGWGLSQDELKKTDEHDVAIRRQYEKSLKELIEASPTPLAARTRRLKNALAIEALLSEKTPREEANAQDSKDAKRWTSSDLAREAPSFPWKEYLQGLHLPSDVAFNVIDPSAIKRISDIMEKQSVEALRDYVYVRALFGLGYALGRALRQPTFELQAARWGMKKDKARLQTCIRITQFTLRDAVALAYADRYHFDKSDPIVLQMIHDIYDAWEGELGDVPWLDDSTRKTALEKLRNIKFHVGYPDKSAVDPMTFDRKTFATNMFRADRARHLQELSAIGGPADRDEWTWSPLVANAYHDHERNGIFVLLAMLTPPIYSPHASIAVQYGTLGMTIGHELGHGFDRYGSNFDPHGVERNWWSDQTKKEFEKRAQCFVDQFSTLPIFPDLNVNGKLSADENIADVAGLRVAFRAYRKHQENAKERVVAEGFRKTNSSFSRALKPGAR